MGGEPGSSGLSRLGRPRGRRAGALPAADAPAAGKVPDVTGDTAPEPPEPKPSSCPSDAAGASWARSPPPRNPSMSRFPRSGMTVVALARIRRSKEKEEPLLLARG